MEEVDAIIIHTLKEIGCSFEENKTRIKELEVNEVIDCSSRCLALILPEEEYSTLSSDTSMNMATKYKAATHLANKCLELGFKGDIGYQTFLYGSEADLRKLFLFLMEKLPKDEERAGPVVSLDEETILKRLKKSPISLTWLPLMTDDEKKAEDTFFETQPMGSILNAKSIVVNKIAPNKRRYYDEFARIPFHDIPSLIEWNSIQLNAVSNAAQANLLKQVTIEKVVKVSDVRRRTSDDVLPVKGQEVRQVSEDGQGGEDAKTKAAEHETRMEAIIHELEEELQQCVEQIKLAENQQNKHGHQVILLEKELKQESEKLREIKSSDKTLDDLKNEMNSIKVDIETMGEQWVQINDALHQQMNEIKLKHRLKSSRSDVLNNELNEIRKSITIKGKDAKHKEALVGELMEKMPNPMPPNRSSYTKRIMEIVNNIKKQNEETNKVLLETRQLQKEINNLSGKLSRAFTITDEAVFKDAKSSDWNRRCYKLLATMHESCEQLLEGVNSIGLIKREILKLEEMVETEQTNKISSNLARIEADLKQMKTENQLLIVKYQGMQQQNQ